MLKSNNHKSSVSLSENCGDKNPLKISCYFSPCCWESEWLPGLHSEKFRRPQNGCKGCTLTLILSSWHPFCQVLIDILASENMWKDYNCETCAIYKKVSSRSSYFWIVKHCDKREKQETFSSERARKFFFSCLWFFLKIA